MGTVPESWSQHVVTAPLGQSPWLGTTSPYIRPAHPLPQHEPIDIARGQIPTHEKILLLVSCGGAAEAPGRRPDDLGVMTYPAPVPAGDHIGETTGAEITALVTADQVPARLSAALANCLFHVVIVTATLNCCSNALITSGAT